MTAPVRAAHAHSSGSLTPGRAAAREGVAAETPWRRIAAPGAAEGRLYFAQVREDPACEIEALVRGRHGREAPPRIVCVSSGGCTALSLLASGAGEVVAVDLNASQNHVVELKAAALARLGSGAAATAFLGGWPAARAERADAYALLRPALGASARAYWDARARQVASGVITTGVSERFIRVVVAAVRAFIHPRSRIERLLACETLEAQRALYEREWDNRRWRALFSVLLNRFVFDRTYEPAFFRNVRNPSFAEHFYRLAEHALTELPVSENYFLHQMLTGHYPRKDGDGGMDGCLPPYLSESGAAAASARLGRLTIVDGDYLSYLRTCADGSVDGFALSNICEWLDQAQTEALFAEILRTAAPGARLCFRNFVGWTDVPPRFAWRVAEDVALGAALSRRDRSVVQPRVVVCRLQPAGTREGA